MSPERSLRIASRSSAHSCWWPGSVILHAATYLLGNPSYVVGRAFAGASPTCCRPDDGPAQSLPTVPNRASTAVLLRPSS